ncbi:hypothetical protein B0O99DRAFT_675038 [Bisporella sp. PMI_857]|nr:hypothetical protein B0O99DRAFT_675038 [Bisporella sp. PMI_857]
MAQVAASRKEMENSQIQQAIDDPPHHCKMDWLVNSSASYHHAAERCCFATYTPLNDFDSSLGVDIIGVGTVVLKVKPSPSTTDSEGVLVLKNVAHIPGLAYNGLSAETLMENRGYSKLCDPTHHVQQGYFNDGRFMWYADCGDGGAYKLAVLGKDDDEDMVTVELEGEEGSTASECNCEFCYEYNDGVGGDVDEGPRSDYAMGIDDVEIPEGVNQPYNINYLSLPTSQIGNSDCNFVQGIASNINSEPDITIYIEKARLEKLALTPGELAEYRKTLSRQEKPIKLEDSSTTCWASGGINNAELTGQRNNALKKAIKQEYADLQLAATIQSTSQSESLGEPRHGLFLASDSIYGAQTKKTFDFNMGPDQYALGASADSRQPGDIPLADQYHLGPCFNPQQSSNICVSHQSYQYPQWAGNITCLSPYHSYVINSPVVRSSSHPLNETPCPSYDQGTHSDADMPKKFINRGIVPIHAAPLHPSGSPGKLSLHVSKQYPSIPSTTNIPPMPLNSSERKKLQEKVEQDKYNHLNFWYQNKEDVEKALYWQKVEVKREQDEGPAIPFYGSLNAVGRKPTIVDAVEWYRKDASRDSYAGYKEELGEGSDVGDDDWDMLDDDGEKEGNEDDSEVSDGEMDYEDVMKQ